MNALLGGARRLAHRAAGRARRRLSGGDGGFVLLESIIAISLITVIMAAIGAEYVTSVASIARQRSTQSAAEVANSTLEQVRALRPSDLVTGRDSASVSTQFSKGNAIPSVSPLLQQMDQASDASAAVGAGANATIPTCDPAPQGAAGPALCTQKPGNIAFTVSQFIGTCWLVTSGASSNCVPAAQKAASSVGYLRVVVSVSWRDGSCNAGCYYVTSTLVNASADPTFKANQPPAPAPAIIPPGDQNDDTGDAVNLQLGLVTGSGVPGFTWTITSGTLPTGLSLSPAGVISGVVSGPIGVQSLTAQVTDGYGRTDTSTFNWTVGTPPTVTAPANQVSGINSSVSLQLATSCTNTPCTYTLNNPPAGLSINNTGLISGTPTVAGTSTMSVTIIDAANRTVTSNTFTWTVLPAAASCPTAVTLPNGSFESPGVGAGAGSNVGNGTSGMVWRTNDSNNQIEYWANGGNSTAQNGNTTITAKDGTQWVEVNGAGMDTLYQDLPTTPGQVLQWSLWHRARNTTGNVNAQDSIQVQMGSTTQQAAQVPSGATSATISDGASAWVRYTGTYTVPASQTTTRFQVAATATSSGNQSAGNFLDAVSVTGVPCTSAPAAQSGTVNNTINPVQLSASQGSGTYTWSGGSSLPAGLTMTASGLITGTPTSTGSTRVQLIVTDQLSGYQQAVAFTWTVYAAPIVSAPTNQTTSAGAAVNVPVASSCPNAACTYTLNNPPAGLSVNTMNGTITGTPTTAGTTTSTLTITDAAGASSTSGTFTWTVKAAPAITSPGNQSTTVGATVSLTPASTCGYPTCTYTVSALPAGLTLNASTGAIAGSPTTAGSTTSTVTIRDAAGTTATTGSFTWTVYAAPSITALANQTTSVGGTASITVGSSCPNTPCTYTLNNPPAGLSMTGATITGTPTATGTTTSTVTVRDAAGITATTPAFTWTVKAAPTVTAPANQTTSVGATVSVAVTSTCANSPCTYLLNGVPGLSINSTTGTISGSPSTAGSTTSTITIRDAAGSSATSASFTWTVRAVPTITSPGDQTTSVGGTVSLAISSSCTNSPCTFSVDVLPAGLTLNPNTGAITGSPTTAGSTASTVTIHDAAGTTATTGAFTWTVKAGPTIYTPPAQTTSVGATINAAIPSTCANGPCTFSVDTLPAGLTLDTTSGTITGSPTTAGTTTSVITIRDADGSTASTGAFTTTVKAAPTVTAPANQTTSVGGTVSLAVTTTCANGPCTYVLNNAPGGLSMTGATITGSPTTAGTTTSTVTVHDAAGSTATSGSFTWTVKAGPTITASNQSTTVGVSVNFTPSSTCANTSCSYSASNLPAGLTINTTTGAITGSPTTAGTSNPTVTIRDAAGSTSSATFTWTINARPTITNPGNQTTTVGASVNVGIGSTCANTPCTYALSGQPAGLTINTSTGVITGTPTTAGTSSSVAVTITDASGVTATTATFTWTVKAAPTITTPTNQTTSVGANVNLATTSTCANTPCTYALSGQPAGLTINSSTGVISGTPTSAGTSSSVKVTITDAAGVTASTATFTWLVKAGPTITTPANQNTDVGVAVNLATTSTCANTPCAYTLSGQPAGLSINSATGSITGTPTTPGTSSVTITSTDAAGATATATFTWTIYARPTITTPGNQTDTVNTALILPISSTCANTPCTYTLSGQPAGLSINSTTGSITGTPTATGTSSAVKVTVTDAGGVAVSTPTFSWTIAAAPSVTSPGNQSTVNNAAVNLTLTKSCPNSPCAYALKGGPTGLSISSAGVVSGTVTSAPRTFSGVTITVTDSSGVTATSASFTWTVTAPLVGRWTFDEASGSTAADSSGAAHPATLAGSTYGRTTTAVQGANAVTLNGSSAAATASNAVLDASTSFTVSAWVKLNNTASIQTFVSQDGTHVSSFALQYRTDTGKFAFSRTSSDSTTPTTTISSSTAAPVVGQWYQLTGVYNDAADTLQLFVDGVNQGNPATYTTDWNGTGSFVIGRGKASNAATNYVNGVIDDVRAYSFALSDEAVTQLAQAAYYRLDDGSGTTAQDGSLNNNSATLSGGTSWTTGIVGPSAVQFNGSNGAATVSSNPIDTSQSFSVSAWAKADTTTSTGTVLSADGSNISSFLLRQNNDKWAMVGVLSDSATTSVTSATATSSLVVGQWYHLVGVYDSVAKTIALYVNGVLQGSPVSVSGNFKASGPLVIGRSYYQGNTNYFAGAIDDVHAFQFAIDQAGVDTLATLAPPTPAAPSATAGSTSATVSWTAPVNVGGSPVTGYVVTPYLNGVAQTPVSYSSTATSQTLTGLSTGGSYTFSVAAVNANGTSATSAVSSSVLVS